MRVKVKGTTKTYSYTGDIYKEIESCEREILRIQEQLPLLQAIFDKAKKELDSKVNRLSDCKTFIKLAKEDIENNKREVE